MEKLPKKNTFYYLNTILILFVMKTSTKFLTWYYLITVGGSDNLKLTEDLTQLHLVSMTTVTTLNHCILDDWLHFSKLFL